MDVLHGLPSRCVSAVRMVAEQAKEPPSHWASMRSVSDKAGCRAETLCAATISLASRCWGCVQEGTAFGVGSGAGERQQYAAKSMELDSEPVN